MHHLKICWLEEKQKIINRIGRILSIFYSGHILITTFLKCTVGVFLLTKMATKLSLIFPTIPSPSLPLLLSRNYLFLGNSYLTVLEICLKSCLLFKLGLGRGRDEVNSEDKLQVIVKRSNFALFGLVPTNNVSKGKILLVFLNKCMSCTQNR